MKRKITKLLTRAILKVNLKGKKNDFYNQDVLFKNLQANTAPLPEYGYDKTTTWTRAAQRFINILKSFDSISLNEKCAFLDAGCGDGMLGILAESFGMKPYLVDMEDWRDERAKRLPLSIQRLEKLDKFDSNIFDLVSSFNTFEHLSDPKIAFEELIRVCKPGGFIFLEFGPIYHGPWGLHAYRSLHMPYPQFLFTEEFTLKKLADLGIYDLGKKNEKLQPLNKWKFSQFLTLWGEHPKCEVISQKRIKNENYVGMILRYPRAFQGKGLTYEDLTTQAIQVLLRKHE